jgi:hypothetical protein
LSIFLVVDAMVLVADESYLRGMQKHLEQESAATAAETGTQEPERETRPVTGRARIRVRTQVRAGNRLFDSQNN